MTQKDKIGGGYTNDGFYTTWEVKECPNCKRVVSETYTVKVLDKEQLKYFKKISSHK